MELDNKTLIYLISIAILITLFGTTISLTKLDQVQSITGRASSGPVNVTVASTTSINLTTNNINWGSGQVDSGETSATLDTNNLTAVALRGSWSASGVNGFVLQNIGNVPVNVTINSTANSTQLINGTNPQFRFMGRIPQGNTTACEDGLQTSQTEFEASIKQRLCNILNYTAQRDSVLIDINLTIPEDAPFGDRNMTIRFDACDVSSPCTP